MTMQAIIKSPHDWAVIPNLNDYQRDRASFSWEKARRELDGLPGALGLNIAHETLHVEIPEADYPKLATLQGCIDYLTAQSQA